MQFLVSKTKSSSFNLTKCDWSGILYDNKSARETTTSNETLRPSTNPTLATSIGKPCFIVHPRRRFGRLCKGIQRKSEWERGAATENQLHSLLNMVINNRGGVATPPSRQPCSVCIQSVCMQAERQLFDTVCRGRLGHHSRLIPIDIVVVSVWDRTISVNPIDTTVVPNKTADCKLCYNNALLIINKQFNTRRMFAM